MGIQINMEGLIGVFGICILVFCFAMWWHWKEQKRKKRIKAERW